MIQGTTTQGINVRSTPQVISGNIVKAITSGVSFEGELVAGLDGKQWIKLSKLAGAVVVNMFIASWVVNYTVVTDPIPLTGSEIPEWFDLTTPDGVTTRYNKQ